MMFNVTRYQPAPVSLASQRNYRQIDVIESLRLMFHGKCYLCEQGAVSAPEVEHFIPHNDDVNLKFGWNNLFYACRRCNGIKSNSHVNLLDCTDVNDNVFEEIEHYANNAFHGVVEIKASNQNPSQKTLNTVRLLLLCFNDESTGLKSVSKEHLLENLLEYYVKYLAHRATLVSRDALPDDIDRAKQHMSLMCNVQYPFSVFWRWQILKDVAVNRKFPTIRIDLGF